MNTKPSSPYKNKSNLISEKCQDNEQNAEIYVLMEAEIMAMAACISVTIL